MFQFNRMRALRDCEGMFGGYSCRSAAELAGRALLRLLGQDHQQYRGIEWWCRNQAAQMGAHFHYDTAISGCEGAAVSSESLRPTLSSVLYLGDVGGPTMILNQGLDSRDTTEQMVGLPW